LARLRPCPPGKASVLFRRFAQVLPRAANRPEMRRIGRCPSRLGRLARLMELPDDPSILVLLVATDGAAWLPEVLKGLRAQQYRPIKVLAVDNAPEPSADGSGAILAKAFGVRRI